MREIRSTSVMASSRGAAALRRRTFLATGLASTGALARLALPGSALASPASAADAQTVLASDAVYFAETGHTVSGPFWQYWRTYGLEAFGYPVSEAFEDAGVLNQYFQRARFELHPGSPVRLGMLGLEVGAAQPPATNADGSPVTPTGPGARLIPETGHIVQGAFLPFYTRYRDVLGPPIGLEQAVPGGYIQYFANGRLEWDASGGTRLGLLGDEVAARRGVDRTPVAAPAGVTTWSDYLAALLADEAERRAFGTRIASGFNFYPGAGERWVLVSVPQQRVTAYDGTRPVFSDLCSTGAAYKGLSSTGVFAIYRRVANEIMDSTTIGYPRGHPKYYRLENVLYTQYYNGGEALHYAWWHNNFGQPMSFGCINLRLSTARWFWDWANVGTRVVVL